MTIPAPTAPARRESLLISVILLVGFALRVFRLGAQSLWYDEGVTVWLGRMDWATMIRWTANDIQPPLAYALAKVWGSAAGWSEFALRFLPLLFSVATIALIYALLRAMNRYAGRTGSAPLWGALLAALHPLFVYYAQEARMYAQLGALVTLAALLIAPALFGEMRWRRWLAFGATMALAAYTHYFAYFALAAIAIAWFWQRATLAPAARGGWTRFLVANGLTLLLFAPWLGIMLQRWGVDASYWQGQFKLLEALRDVAQRFTTGETMREATAIWLALAIAILLLGLGIGAWRGETSLRPLLRLALCWLLLPVAAVILLAVSAPKFNPRYVYLALPGMILIAAAGLDWLTAPREVSTAARLATIGTLIILFVPMVWANANWFFNGDFNKAQWRELTEYLRPRLTEEERVLLVSGHAVPVWDYYAPDIPVVRLPDIDVLDVEEVLTFANTAAPLRAALETHPGAWLVQWQEEVVDPNEVVRTQLELGGREKGLTATFNQLELDRFSQIRTVRISDSAPISVTVGANFGSSVNFTGYRPLDNGDLLLFWMLPNATDADLHMALEVLDANGAPLRHIGDRRIAGYNYPTFRWRPGEVNMARIAIDDWLGFSLEEYESGAAGAENAYQMRLRVYDAADPEHVPLQLPDGSTELIVPNVRPILE